MSRVVDRAYGEKEFPPSPYNTQFTTRTLLLWLFWFGTGMSVWSLRQPWSESGDTLPASTPITQQSPDGQRIAVVVHYLNKFPRATIMRQEHSSNTDLYEVPFLVASAEIQFGFVDDDRVLLIEPDGKTTHLYKRRFPDTWMGNWWGHLYRPELWIFVAFSLYMCWRILKYLRNIPDITK